MIETPSSNALQLSISDLRQFMFCQRVLYWKKVRPVPYVETRKMTWAKEAEPRGLKGVLASRLLEPWLFAERRRSTWVSSDALRLNGIADAILLREHDLAVIELKNSGDIWGSAWIQAFAYGVAAEETFDLPCSTVFVARRDGRHVAAHSFSEAERSQVTNLVSRVRAHIASERFPLVAPRMSKCRDCEYRLWCGDRPD